MMDGGAIYIDYANLEFLPQDATYESNRILNDVRPFHTMVSGKGLARSHRGSLSSNKYR